MTWWVFQNSRLVTEKAALAELEGHVDWLRVASWQADSLCCGRFHVAVAQKSQC